MSHHHSDPDHNVGPTPYLDVYLPGYHVQLHEDAVQHSIDKLRESKDDLQHQHANQINYDNIIIQTHPCLTLEETLDYRCHCSFQFVREENDDNNDDDRGPLEYAMREQGQVKRLGSSRFPIANIGIQNTMHRLLDELNSTTTTILQDHLTSVTFASTWDERDVVVTLHYDHPVDESAWLIQASLVRDKLSLFKLSSRSKGKLISLPPGPTHLKDTIWLYPGNHTVSINSPWTATTTKTTTDSTTSSYIDTAAAHTAAVTDAIPVHYEKPETAFFHPNPRVMTKVLGWILSRLTTPRQQPQSSLISSSISSSRPRQQGYRLLELYCGCGAHTMALAKSGLLTEIVAMELDQRLVDACIRNAVLNHCHEQGSTPVRVIQGDAGMCWSKKGHWTKPFSLQMKNQQDYFFDVLLVDPPRQGLDPQVCSMAMQHGNFQHVLYISCGREALKRDLDMLLQVFDIVDCQLFDLFPRTDSIESVVHLRRRQSSSSAAHHHGVE